MDADVHYDKHEASGIRGGRVWLKVMYPCVRLASDGTVMVVIANSTQPGITHEENLNSRSH